MVLKFVQFRAMMALLIKASGVEREKRERVDAVLL